MATKKFETHHHINAIAVIPARGGSVRIPGKNLADFDGVPSIARVIQMAHESAIFNRVIVSTDDKNIAICAKKAGAEIIERPADLSDGLTPIQPVVAHVIAATPEATHICLLLATAVLLLPKRLHTAITMLSEDPQLDFVIGIRKFESPPQRGFSLNDEGCVEMVSPEHFNTRSQDLPSLYHDAGQFSFGHRDAWLSGKASFMMRTRGIELLKWESVDIDEPEDLDFARLLFHSQKKT
jgi:pseudaminic acid cytidylyltransferase